MGQLSETTMQSLKSTVKMVRVWGLMLVCWAWSPLCLSSTVSFIGSPQQCKKAPFVPGYNLGGEGFDIVTMKRKGAYVINTETWDLGNKTCRMFKNSYMKGEKQKVPAAVVDWRALPKCSLKVSSTLYDSVESLVNDSTSSVSNNWKLGLDIPAHFSVTVGVGFGGSHSRASEFGMRKSKRDRYDFVRHSVHCNTYRYRLTTEPPLSQAFVSAVNSLPPYSSLSEVSYRHLIDTYGTHYITQVSLGGEIKAISSFKTCKASLSGLTASEVGDCLSVGASVNFAQNDGIKAMYRHCQALKSKLSGRRFSSLFNERFTEVIGGDQRGLVLFLGYSNPSIYNNWIASLKKTPDVIQYNLKPLHTILPNNHKARKGLKKEVEKYIKNNAVLKKCSESCPIGHRSSRRDPCACVCNGNQMIRSNCCPAGRGLATLKVYGLYARGLYGDVSTQTDGSVVVRYKDQIKRTAIIANNDNPKWSEVFKFGPIVINTVNKLRFTVYDEDTYWNSDLLGKCSIYLRRGLVSDSCMFKYGTFFFTYKVQCGPHLGGSRCDEYIPCSMNPSLADVFYTRNGILVGESENVYANSTFPSG